MKLSPAQRRELTLLARAPQATYGTSRTKVQHNLVDRELACFVGDDGAPVSRDFSCRCAITDAGRAALKVPATMAGWVGLKVRLRERIQTLGGSVAEAGAIMLVESTSNGGLHLNHEHEPNKIGGRFRGVRPRKVEVV